MAFALIPSLLLSLGEDVGEKGPASLIADMVVFSLFLTAKGLVADISISLVGRRSRTELAFPYRFCFGLRLTISSA